MKLTTTALALSATACSGVLAAVVPQQPMATIPAQHVNYDPNKFLIELAPYQTRWVTEEEKWALKLVCITSSTEQYYTTHALPRCRQTSANWQPCYRMGSISSMSPMHATQEHIPPSFVRPTAFATRRRWNTRTR